MSLTWPVSLRHGPIVLRPMRRRDQKAWREVRSANADWLRPWEATSPDGAGYASYSAMLRANQRMARAGTGLVFGIFVDGRFAGQITLATIVWGSMRSASIGYWIDRRQAGRGITPAAVAMVYDHAIFSVGLHRVEINVRPENDRSLRVVGKLGFREEGMRRRFLHIDGQWADHRTFALTAEDTPTGLLSRWQVRDLT